MNWPPQPGTWRQARAPVWAQIAPGNAASVRAFLAAGFSEPSRRRRAGPAPRSGQPRRPPATGHPPKAGHDPPKAGNGRADIGSCGDAAGGAWVHDDHSPVAATRGVQLIDRVPVPAALVVQIGRLAGGSGVAVPGWLVTRRSVRAPKPDTVVYGTPVRYRATAAAGAMPMKIGLAGSGAVRADPDLSHQRREGAEGLGRQADRIAGEGVAAGRQVVAPVVRSPAWRCVLAGPPQDAAAAEQPDRDEHEHRADDR